ncbi:MAG TPA: L,D-transpeptidase family protein [Solirubrobacteraceae bacterium]|nr:L,D-transpeptidase family protein [Solirubrobacteraceae bacterium]
MSSRRLALGLCVSALAIVHGQALLPGAQAAAQSPQPSAPVSPSPETPAEGAAGIQPAASGPAAVPPSSRRLSNERTLTTWAHPVEPGPIYAMPETNSRRVGRVHLETEDGFPEVYLLLTSHVDAHGREWIKLRIPGRPNGRKGWVERELLGTFHHTRWLIVVNRSERRLTAYYDGHVRMVAPVGIGKPSTPTPPGHFWIRERFRITNPSSPYWPYALGTSDYSTLSEWPGGGVVGIHGAFGEPQKIPGDPSHGCVRMLDPDIAWLAPRVTLGTPVDIITR